MCPAEGRLKVHCDGSYDGKTDAVAIGIVNRDKEAKDLELTNMTFEVDYAEFCWCCKKNSVDDVDLKGKWEMQTVLVALAEFDGADITLKSREGRTETTNWIAVECRKGYGSSASLSLAYTIRAAFNPEHVVMDVQRRINASLSRRQLLSVDKSDQTPGCLTGNPIDDCWRCDPNWATDRQKLADCGIGFGTDAAGGKGGQFYIVTDPSDNDPVNPAPGTLRHAVIQDVPLWIVFAGNMMITLKHELMFNSFKTIDGRGASVHITGDGCITLQYVSNIIIHNVHIHHCRPSSKTMIRASPTKVGLRGGSDGDGVSIYGSQKIWIDHCRLAYCTDGLIDAIMGSTGITISNNHFSHHDEVMLLGHDDRYEGDRMMQVTVAFNHFGEKLVQRMPRCRHGYVHVVNNDYTQWEMYAIGGSAAPTINSQGNRYTAPANANAKEVTKRVDTDEREWATWNWKTEGDLMVNGAYFVGSGDWVSTQYAQDSSLPPQSALHIDLLTLNAGVFNDPSEGGDIYPAFTENDGSGISGDGIMPRHGSTNNASLLSPLFAFLLFCTIASTVILILMSLY
ncbi:probable pectate lyase 18 [Neltuma alba]|uniref:probable pectate lyase 18 n=1 Tax=Neltuma alba TaxID=207710 RepID=UPI0010A47145|nr:probable pectate lyase 18 [Prosopis alba]